MLEIPIVPYPPPEIQSLIPPDKWAKYQDSCVTALTHHLLLPTPAFQNSLKDTHLIEFLTTYASNQAPTTQNPPLRRKVVQILHRIYTTASPKHVPGQLVTATFLTELSREFGKNRVIRELLDKEEVWGLFEKDVLKCGLEDAVSVVRFLPRVSESLLAGDEWMEGAIARGEVAALATALVAVASRQNWGFLGDVLYKLVAEGKRDGKTGEFVRKLIWETPVVRILEREVDGVPEEGRISGVLEEVRSFGPVRKKDKGKGREVLDLEGLSREEESSLTTKVESVRDILPHLGTGFVRRCLLQMDGDVERVTAAVLEGNLPGDLNLADQGEEFIPPEAPEPPSAYATPPSEPADSEFPALPVRRNIFDNDELDLLTPSATTRLHQGNKTNKLTADKLLDAPEVPKSAIYAALEAFDPDDDERDDTYDLADIGGTVDTSAPPGDGYSGDREGDSAENVLWDAYNSSPEVFNRDSETRRGKARKDLKDRTSMTDEAIEGWKVMLERDPNRLRAMERKFTDRGVLQNVIAKNSWRAGGDARGRGGGGRGARGGRGGGGVGRGRGSGSSGDVTGPANGKEMQQGRAKKEANKGSKANHNRRDQRAKKMARGFTE
ncbi:unnamed protein product [Tuber melanosporum]|uniref:(Perigord truffle) hypothetical protein n=1 Tax=Tuber melanosporum (strain Mel28) TaxID=656061 RepID=D5G570_TUBMM|nr:uncharacterized protein GSTUM_00000281001 [Tuber melanosporum]CAZ79655.1 unnamed protein product [Tuber melanosporum]